LNQSHFLMFVPQMIFMW